ncbi:phage portal protein [Pusillimonas sp. ANT_WB101]|uniref:phage portal protein n=1 Tax=Pusillimonas sp. ANT_WB101 TaxID=2597356 RepID=UPI0011ECCEEF|nr:phage portal protein [Pusillimonas sp. ANT_WB101]KAA0893070.1 phage portal protein [Pusillimonas sp. ANT_WB101]
MIKRLLTRLGYEKRANGDNYWEGFQALRSGSVTAETAQSVSAVYAAVNLIAGTVGSLPLHLYERDDQRTKAKKHPLYTVLHSIANEHQTALEFREMMTASVLLRGNAYARVVRGYDGQVRELIPIHPDRMSLYRTANGVIYEHTDHAGKVQKLLQDEVFHLKHRADGEALLGVSPIQASRETIELSISERDHGVSTFRNGAKLSGVLKFPQHLKAEQKASLKASWDSQHSGNQNAGRTAILDQGVDFQTVSMSMEDSEWVSARKFSVEEVARIFGISPVMIGDLTHGNFSNSVEMSRQFVTFGLRRHLVSWEQAVTKQLLTPAGRQRFKPEHSVEGLLRGDSTTRAAFYANGIASGWMLPSEARRLENLPKVDGIDEIHTQEGQRQDATSRQRGLAQVT